MKMIPSIGRLDFGDQWMHRCALYSETKGETAFGREKGHDTSFFLPNFYQPVVRCSTIIGGLQETRPIGHNRNPHARKILQSHGPSKPCAEPKRCRPATPGYTSSSSSLGQSAHESAVGWCWFMKDLAGWPFCTLSVTCQEGNQVIDNMVTSQKQQEKPSPDVQTLRFCICHIRCRTNGQIRAQRQSEFKGREKIPPFDERKSIAGVDV